MKTKLLIVVMLLLSLVVLSGCDYQTIEEEESERECLKETAEEFCAERDCVVDTVIDTYFYVYKGEWRERVKIFFTDKEEESCEVKNVNSNT